MHVLLHLGFASQFVFDWLFLIYREASYLYINFASYNLQNYQFKHFFGNLQSFLYTIEKKMLLLPSSLDALYVSFFLNFSGWMPVPCGTAVMKCTLNIVLYLEKFLTIVYDISYGLFTFVTFFIHALYYSKITYFHF